MSDGFVVLASVGIAFLSLLAALLAWVAGIRWARESRESAAQAIQANREELLLMERQVDFLKDLDSVRLTERYIETKKGLEEHIAGLEGNLREIEERRGVIERQIDDLQVEGDRHDAEVGQLRTDLTRTQHDCHKLEQVVQAIRTVGPIPIEAVRRELEKRRRWQVDIRARLDRLELEEELKEAEVARLRDELEALRGEVARLEREIEVTRAAGPIVDAMLGISPDLSNRVIRTGEQLGELLPRLARGERHGSAAAFLKAVHRGTPGSDRLLGGASGTSPDDGPASASEHVAEPAPAIEASGGAQTGSAEDLETDPAVTSGGVDGRAEHPGGPETQGDPAVEGDGAPPTLPLAASEGPGPDPAERPWQ